MACQYPMSAVFLLVLSCIASDSARILGIFTYNGRSQFVMFEALMKGLAAKGHDVTVASHFPQQTILPNYTDISLNGSLPQAVGSYAVEYLQGLSPLQQMNVIWTFSVKHCQVSLEHPLMTSLMKSNKTFDVIITGIFGSDCWIGLAHKMNIPIIGMVSTAGLPWTNDRLGNINNPSYIPNVFLPYTQEMNFMQRLWNTLLNIASIWCQYFKAELPTDRLLREKFGDNIPPVSELKKNISLMFVNSHFSIHYSRPTVPAVVEVGGLHIQARKSLPQAIEKFINGAQHGVIYFSFGSLINGRTLSKHKRLAFIEAFKSLDQRIIWKIDGISANQVPPNVMTSDWLPQQDILSHPNVRLFISHCGLMGTQEAVFAGVPIIGIPIFIDQKQNIEFLLQAGSALKLDYTDITKERVLSTIKTVLNDPSYRRTAKLISERFRDRPQSPLETAIFWTEYVIRHGGAAHLRSVTVDIPLYQYLLLDVIGVFLLGLVSLLAAMWFMCNRTIMFITASGEDEKVVSKKRV